MKVQVKVNLLISATRRHAHRGPTSSCLKHCRIFQESHFKNLSINCAASVQQALKGKKKSWIVCYERDDRLQSFWVHTEVLKTQIMLIMNSASTLFLVLSATKNRFPQTLCFPCSTTNQHCWSQCVLTA